MSSSSSQKKAGTSLNVAAELIRVDSTPEMIWQSHASKVHLLPHHCANDLSCTQASLVVICCAEGWSEDHQILLHSVQGVAGSQLLLPASETNDHVSFLCQLGLNRQPDASCCNCGACQQERGLCQSALCPLSSQFWNMRNGPDCQICALLPCAAKYKLSPMGHCFCCHILSGISQSGSREVFSSLLFAFQHCDRPSVSRVSRGEQVRLVSDHMYGSAGCSAMNGSCTARIQILCAIY